MVDGTVKRPFQLITGKKSTLEQTSFLSFLCGSLKKKKK